MTLKKIVVGIRTIKLVEYNSRNYRSSRFFSKAEYSESEIIKLIHDDYVRNYGESNELIEISIDSVEID